MVSAMKDIIFFIIWKNGTLVSPVSCRIYRSFSDLITFFFKSVEECAVEECSIAESSYFTFFHGTFFHGLLKKGYHCNKFRG